MQEGVIEFIDKVVYCLFGKEEVLDLLDFCPHPVAVLVEHEDIAISRLIEQLEAVVTDVQMHLLLAGLVDQEKLLEHVLDDLIQLSAILDQFEHLLIDPTDVWTLQNAFEHSHVAH